MKFKEFKEGIYRVAAKTAIDDKIDTLHKELANEIGFRQKDCKNLTRRTTDLEDKLDALEKRYKEDIDKQNEAMLVIQLKLNSFIGYATTTNMSEEKHKCEDVDNTKPKKISSGRISIKIPTGAASYIESDKLIAAYNDLLEENHKLKINCAFLENICNKNEDEARRHSRDTDTMIEEIKALKNKNKTLEIINKRLDSENESLKHRNEIFDMGGKIVIDTLKGQLKDIKDVTDIINNE